MGTALCVAVMVIISVLVYFFPSMVARKNGNLIVILLVNFFFGVSLVGWVIALIWAIQGRGGPSRCARIETESPTISTPSQQSPEFDDRLRKLAKLQQDGILTSEEFADRKKRILDGIA